MCAVFIAEREGGERSEIGRVNALPDSPRLQ